MRTTARGLAFTVAVWFVPLAFVLLPFLAFAAFSLWIKEDTNFVPAVSLANYHRWFSEPIYARVFVLTLWLACGVTAVILLVSYPIAWFMHRLNGRLKMFALALMVTPLFLSYIVKLYAIRSLFGSKGYLAVALDALGVSIPLSWLLFSQTAIFVTMAMVYLPFAILPIFLTLERIPKILSAAAADLGARPGQAFWRITFPLSLPGTMSGAMIVFLIARGDFVTPQMVGGSRGLTYGKLVFSQFGLALEWPFGAAMAMILLAASLAAITLAVMVARKGSVAL